jgi:hypothetical protein
LTVDPSLHASAVISSRIEDKAVVVEEYLRTH